jgi:hypothetical protein
MNGLKGIEKKKTKYGAKYLINKGELEAYFNKV